MAYTNMNKEELYTNNNCAAATVIKGLKEAGVPLSARDEAHLVGLFWGYSKELGCREGEPMPEEVFTKFTEQHTYAVLVISYEVKWNGDKAGFSVQGARLYCTGTPSKIVCVRVQISEGNLPMHWASSSEYSQAQLTRFALNRSNDGITVWDTAQFKALSKFIKLTTNAADRPKQEAVSEEEPISVPEPSAPAIEKFSCEHCQYIGGTDEKHTGSECVYNPYN
jgi:hypothetical protein